jgi:hypothetical protein
MMMASVMTKCGGMQSTAAAGERKVGDRDSEEEEATVASPPLLPNLLHPFLPTVVLRPTSLKRLMRFHNRAESSSSTGGRQQQAAEEDNMQPQDLSVKRRDQESQTDCDNDGEKKKKKRMKEELEEVDAAAAAATSVEKDSELERAKLRDMYLRRVLILIRTLIRRKDILGAAGTIGTSTAADGGEGSTGGGGSSKRAQSSFQKVDKHFRVTTTDSNRAS